MLKLNLLCSYNSVVFSFLWGQNVNRPINRLFIRSQSFFHVRKQTEKRFCRFVVQLFSGLSDALEFAMVVRVNDNVAVARGKQPGCRTGNRSGRGSRGGRGGHGGVGLLVCWSAASIRQFICHYTTSFSHRPR